MNLQYLAEQIILKMEWDRNWKIFLNTQKIKKYFTIDSEDIPILGTLLSSTE